MPCLTIVVPTFNETANVAVLVERLNARLVDVDVEILFVDDSTDRTPVAIREQAMSSRLPVRLLHRSVPDGRLAGAVVAGIRAADSPWIVVMDSDLQHPPAVVPALYQRALTAGSDVVVASRYLGGGSSAGLDGRLRRLVSRWSGGLARLLFPRRLGGCTDPMSGFFAVRRDALRLDDVTQCGYKVLLAILLHAPVTVAEVPFEFARRFAGESKASLREGLRFLWLLALLRTRATPHVDGRRRRPAIAPTTAALPPATPAIARDTTVPFQYTVPLNSTVPPLLAGAATPGCDR